MKLAAALVTFVGLLLAAPAQAVPQERRPNVLFIGVDDLNDWIGPLGGHPAARTPHLDRLAARGTVFRRAYTAAPACNPSRVALLTGIRPSTSGVYLNSHACAGCRLGSIWKGRACARSCRTPREPGISRLSPLTAGSTTPFETSSGDTSATPTVPKSCTTIEAIQWNGGIWRGIPGTRR